MKLLGWILVLIIAILVSLALGHNMETEAWRCERCGAQKEQVKVSCWNVTLHRSEPYEGSCGGGAHQWGIPSVVTEKGVLGVLGKTYTEKES